MGIEIPNMRNHTAVRLNNYIVVIGGEASRSQHKRPNKDLRRIIWTYNLVTERWKLHMSTGQVPGLFRGACGIGIGEDIYTFGGCSYAIERESFLPLSRVQRQSARPLTNDVWKLTQGANNNFMWSKMCVNLNEPSPRMMHSGWEYNGKLWVFGGLGTTPNGYLNEYGNFRFAGHYALEELYNNNQLLQFDPDNNTWRNVECLGEVPAPRCKHAATASDHNVWLFGGEPGEISDDLFQLDMGTLTWTKLQTPMPKPQLRHSCSLNITAESKLVLHGGERGAKFHGTWIMDLASQSWSYVTAKADDSRCRHTGSLGLNSIVIIGGEDIPYTHAYSNHRSETCVPVRHIMLEPKALQLLAIMTLRKHLSRNSSLRNCIKLLPDKLKDLVEMY